MKRAESEVVFLEIVYKALKRQLDKRIFDGTEGGGRELKGP
jgi:hypothetical protein